MKTMHWMAAVAAILASGLTAPARADTVDVDGGSIQGSELAGVKVYKGIPFAAPPVGPLRWKAPQPVKPWAGVLDCTRFGPACPQPASSLGPAPASQSEDCLTLNIWTAAKAPGEKRPVMVWIHGGGNVQGSASRVAYDGKQFAAHGVVLVSINYRLGVFGFLAHPALSAESSHKVSGNYSILDQIAALHWVQRNISKFGGNPGNVTVFGESAGAVDTGVLLISPLAKGLFQRAIMESGTPTGVRTRLTGADAADKVGQQVFQAVGAKTLDEARARPARQLLDSVKAKVGPLSRGAAFGPVIDGWVVPDDPMKLFKEGKFADVPVMIGTNANEGSLFTRALPQTGPLVYRLLVRRFFGADAQAVLDLFPAGPDAATARDSLNRLVTVGAFVAPARRMARYVSAHQPLTFVYHFTRVDALLKRLGLGATHGSEILYVFGAFPPRMQAAAEDLALSKQIQAYWIQFATTGDPNKAGQHDWPRYTSAADACLELGDKIQVDAHLSQAACNLMDRVKIGLPAAG